MATELWDLYDINRNPLGRTFPRGEMNVGEYHIVVSIWTISSDNKILLTLRSPDKEPFPNKWECTGGSALAGETSIEAAMRELFEETGITASTEELTLIDSDTGDSAFFDVYLLRRDVKLSELTFQQGETAGARWVTMLELESLYSDGEFAFPHERRLRPLRAMFDAALGNVGE